jgi:hypothetical protein
MIWRVVALLAFAVVLASVANPVLSQFGGSLPCGMATAPSCSAVAPAPTPALPNAPNASIGKGLVVQSGLQPLFPDVPPGGYPHRVFTPGNCTWWAAFNHLVPQWTPDGDAWHWYGNAIRDGIATSRSPSVGAVVVYQRGSAYGKFGHVAIVIAVGPKSFRVSEMNFIGLNKIDERDSPWPDGNVAGFIPK